jgi:hypothetical protein
MIHLLQNITSGLGTFSDKNHIGAKLTIDDIALSNKFRIVTQRAVGGITDEIATNFGDVSRDDSTSDDNVLVLNFVVVQSNQNRSKFGVIVMVLVTRRWSVDKDEEGLGMSNAFSEVGGSPQVLGFLKIFLDRRLI